MVKKILKAIVILLFVAFVIAQFFRPDFANPPVSQAMTLENNAAVPEDVRMILGRSCADCHTNTTTFPWYAQISPVSWFLKDHIDEGRRELNFSTWGSYEPRRKKKKLEEVCEQIKAREMPLPSYLWIHRDAVLSEQEIKTLCDWTEAESGRIAEPE